MIPRWHEVTAIFGGRFDPPHLGHRLAVKSLFKEPGVQRVLIIPSASPPHKAAQISAAHRLALTQLAFESNLVDPLPSEIEIDDRELVRAQLNPQTPSYSYETLQELRQIYPRLAFVIGTDQLLQLHTWHRFPEILNLCHWIVIERKSESKDDCEKVLQQWEASGMTQKASHQSWQLKGSAHFIQKVQTEAPQVSSTQIRESIMRTGEPPNGSLLPKVVEYLKQNRLYGMKNTP
jgi:nicotinate-nucleotide adenylyltransferase